MPLHGDRTTLGLHGSDRPFVIGVDGCRLGWVAMVWDVATRRLEPQFVPTLCELIDAYPNATIGVDMPIGLSATGRRQCDVDARKFLGQPRGSSVFPPPIPEVLVASTYKEACEISIRFHQEHKSISKQTFGILPKLREVRELVTTELRGRIIEVHPEVSFATLAGKRLSWGKLDDGGYDERIALLESVFDLNLPSPSGLRKLVPWAGADDALDAMVAAWSAYRFVEGRADKFPVIEERDETGLRMEMVF